MRRGTATMSRGATMRRGIATMSRYVSPLTAQLKVRSAGSDTTMRKSAGAMDGRPHRVCERETILRHPLIKAVLTVLCLAAPVALPASAAAVTVGISDNGSAMFSSPYFIRLHLKQARLLVEWNAAVLRNHSALNAARAWISAAQADGVSPLIDFDADPGKAGNYIPTVSVYTKAVKAFIKDFPTVKQYIPWNEPDWNFRPGLAKHPTLAAAYFNALVQACRGCTVVAGDVYLDAAHLGAYVRAYEKGLHYRPAAWALHPYDDVQGHTTAQIRAMLKAIPRGSQLWLTEISGVIRRGHWHGNHILTQTPAKQAADEAYLFSLAKRFRQITRIYHYQWQGSSYIGWDSGLLSPNGKPRPAYYVLAKAAG
jgi:hypothetical protein